jgi:hypothetical protein
VVVDQDESGAPGLALPWVHERGGLGARRVQCVHEGVVLGIQEDHPEVFLVVVVGPEKVASEERDGLR